MFATSGITQLVVHIKEPRALNGSHWATEAQRVQKKQTFESNPEEMYLNRQNIWSIVQPYLVET